ncbi:hypothetical protein SDC9_149887 [bioreactor metagenome]|uniref:Uncharacterized protein n=1 Tax=bioreactor metagenome TaxID=1076179 RepID=A0A645EL01_9ZZZZ
MAAPLRLAGQHGTDDAGLGVAHAAVALEAQQQDVGDHQDRQDDQTPQPSDVEELPPQEFGGVAGVHLLTPCGGWCSTAAVRR